jgi:hypothetical protein
MMTQEEFMDVVALRRQGWTITDIAAMVGRHPETVSKWLKQGGPPARRQVAIMMIDRRWAMRIDQLLERNPNLLATSVARILAAEGLVAATPPWCGICAPSGASAGVGPPARRCRSRPPG